MFLEVLVPVVTDDRRSALSSVANRLRPAELKAPQLADDREAQPPGLEAQRRAPELTSESMPRALVKPIQVRIAAEPDLPTQRRRQRAVFRPHVFCQPSQELRAYGTCCLESASAIGVWMLAVAR